MNKKQLKEEIRFLSIGSTCFGAAVFPLVWIMITLIIAIVMTITGVTSDIATSQVEPTQTSLVSMLAGLVIVGIAFVIVSVKTMKKIKEQIIDNFFNGTNLKLLKSKLSELTTVGTILGVAVYILWGEILNIIGHLVPKTINVSMSETTLAWLVLLAIFICIIGLIVIVVYLSKEIKKTKKKILTEFVERKHKKLKEVKNE